MTRGGPKTWMAVAMMATLAAATGCGGSNDSDASESNAPTTAAERAVTDVQAGLADGDGERVCDALTVVGRYELARLRPGGRGCERIVEEIASRPRPEGFELEPSLERVTILGRSRAVARVRDARGKVDFVPLLEERSDWKLSSLALLDAEAIDNPPNGPARRYAEPELYTPPEVIYDVQTDYLRARSSSVCDDLTAAGVREISRNPGSCHVHLAALRRRSLARGREPRISRVISVRGSGRRRTLVVEDVGGEHRRLVPIVRVDGRWRLPSASLALNLAR